MDSHCLQLKHFYQRVLYKNTNRGGIVVELLTINFLIHIFLLLSQILGYFLYQLLFDFNSFEMQTYQGQDVELISCFWYQNVIMAKNPGVAQIISTSQDILYFYNSTRNTPNYLNISIYLSSTKYKHIKCSNQSQSRFPGDRNPWWE